MKKLSVDVWSDVVCPWCYIGKRRLESALAKFSHRDDVELVWRAFELDPSAPKIAVGDHAERIAKKYGRSREQIAEMTRNITSLAAVEGLDFQLEASRSGNTFDAHRVLHLAGERGKQDAVKERFFKGYMTEKEAIGDPEVLIRLAAEAGLDAEEVRAVLASDRYAKEVREEEAAARQLQISGVPFFVLGG
jgi:predicted DsbA family dithiol-disulfide isomerase